MTASAPAERREFRRLTLPLPARFKLRDSRVVRRGTIQNISSLGAAILTPVPLPTNGIVDELRFSLPPENGESKLNVSVAAAVVRSEPNPLADSSERYRSGLAFFGWDGRRFEKVCKTIDRELGDSAKTR